MYESTITIKLNKVKGQELQYDERIKATFDKEIVQNLVDNLKEKFSQMRIEADISTTIEWKPNGG